MMPAAAGAPGRPQRRARRHGAALGVAACLAGPVVADVDPDLGALQLADQTPIQAQAAHSWRAFVEGAFSGAQLRSDSGGQSGRRVSLGGQYDDALAPGWRLTLTDQLDVNWPAQSPGGSKAINTFKEGYVSWQPRDDDLVDLGRVNVRNGVATGYNPTDYFKVGALRSVISVDPATLKENRQGSVLLRDQLLWSSGSVTVLYAPRFSARASTAGFSPDWGATNDRGRWLVAGSAQLAPGISPQLLLYKADGLPAQWGGNLTGLLSDATVVFGEWSGGRGPSLLSQALSRVAVPYPSDDAWRNRVAAGWTWTATNKFALTTELEYNGGGLDRADWDRLQRGPLALYGAYRSGLEVAQEAPTRRAVFLYARWQDCVVNRLDLASMLRWDVDDRSSMAWIEARYRFTRSELALQWERNRGTPLSDFGASPQAQTWQAELRYYF